MRRVSKTPLFLGIIAAAAVLAALGFYILSNAHSGSASMSVALVDESGNARANYTGSATPLAVAFSSPLPGGGATQVEIRDRDEFWFTPVVKINLEKFTSQNVAFTVKLKVDSRNATWGGSAIPVQNFASTVMEKDFTYTKAGTYELSGVGNGKIPCSALLASPPTQASPNKQLKVTYGITVELYSNGVLIGSQSTTVSAALDFQYKPDGAVSISGVNIKPTWVQVV
ncbi:MAG: hypothetical protein ABC585_05700 [Candidatus Methanosuratincola petrocarbonis]